MSDVGTGRAKNACLMVVQGEDTGDVFTLRPGVDLLVGRAPSNDIVLADQGVSRQHARFWRRNDAVGVTDMKSRNGTFVGTERVEERALSSGDTVWLGPSVGVRFFWAPLRAEEEHRRKIVEQLDLPLLVCSADASRVEFANAAARLLLHGIADQVPPTLQAVLKEAATKPHHQMEWEMADGSRVSVRAHAMEEGSGALLATVTPDDRRAHNLIGLLSERYGLSHSDAKIAMLVCTGLSNAEIGDRLGLRVTTVKQYMTRIFESLGVHSRTRMVALIDALRQPTYSGGDTIAHKAAEGSSDRLDRNRSP